MSDRLSDLLDQRARESAGVRPSLDGVHAAIGARAARRRRQRVAGTALAGLCLVAGIAGGIALAGGDDDAAPVVPADSGDLPEVPLVGIELEGFVPGEPQIGELDLDDEPPRTVVVFRPGRSLADPFVTVAVQPPAPDEDFVGSLDLDGDGLGDATDGGSHLGIGIDWRLADGSAVSVGGELTDGQASDDALVAYARELFGPTLDLDDVPPPAGFPERDTWTLPDPRGPAEAQVSYQADDGSGQRLTVSATNQPGWFEVLQDQTSTQPAPGYGFEEIALGPSFLGPGRAILAVAEGLGTYALIRTDAGLTIEIDANVDAGTIRDIISTGAFVDLGPSTAPTTTEIATASTYVPPSTTAPVDSDTGVGGSGTGAGALDRIEVEPGPVGDRVVLHFEGGIPAWEVTASDEPTQPGEGSCPDASDPGRTYLRVRLEIPSPEDPAREPAPESGYGALNPSVDGVVQGAYLPCSWFEGIVWVDVSLDRSADFRVQELQDPSRLVIDVVD